MDGDMFLWLMPGRRSLEEAGQPLLEYSRSWGRGRGQGELSLDSDLGARLQRCPEANFNCSCIPETIQNDQGQQFQERLGGW